MHFCNKRSIFLFATVVCIQYEYTRNMKYNILISGIKIIHEVIQLVSPLITAFYNYIMIIVGYKQCTCIFQNFKHEM